MAKLYRYEAIRNSICLDVYSDLYVNGPYRLHAYEFEIYKETPKGCWIHGGTRWVSNTSRKRYAHRTLEDALEAYRFRKEAYLRHSRSTLNMALEQLALAENING